jgi:uncharacterized protein (DUF934 family)
MQRTLILIPAQAAPAASPDVLRLTNDIDPLTVALEGVNCIELDFPKFSDGRAFSQAFMLRRRRGFTGDLRATGDVLVDQLVLMQRSGFTSAVLRADQDLVHAERQFALHPVPYQGDAVRPQPLFGVPA